MNKASPNKYVVSAALLLGAAGLGYTLLSGSGPGPASGMIAAEAKEGISIPAPAAEITEASELQTAIFAGGCFWGVEGVFEQIGGVVSAESGYSGGLKSNANYELVSSGFTSHAETVRVIYDPAKVSYDQLLHIFFSVAHDPTQLNRQGPDKGRQYRTAIFPANPAQESAARSYIAQLEKANVWDDPIVTTIEAFSFFPAEEYHQDFMRKNPRHSYIVAWDAPKIANLKRLFPQLLK